MNKERLKLKKVKDYVRAIRLVWERGYGKAGCDLFSELEQYLDEDDEE